MHRKLLFIVLASQLIVGAALAQTSVIAYRSHSGNMYSFNPAAIPDNLGWTGFERNTSIDTSLNLLPSGDTVSGYPYCNNPAISQDSLNKNYPFYTTAIPDSTPKTPAANDTLAKPKERIKSRSEVRKNELVPLVDFYGNPQNPAKPGSGFLLGLLAVLAIIGSWIWLVNRKKIQAV